MIPECFSIVVRWSTNALGEMQCLRPCLGCVGVDDEARVECFGVAAAVGWWSPQRELSLILWNESGMKACGWRFGIGIVIGKEVERWREITN